MTDEELITTLRGRNGFGWTEDAADRVEQLVNEKVLNKAAYEGVSSLLLSTQKDSIANHGRAELTEANLAKATTFIKRILAIAPDGDEDQWHIMLDDAQYFITELEKTK